MSDSKYRPKSHYEKNGPAWFRHMTTQRPNRAKEHALEKKIKSGVDPDEIQWPTWNKPKIYWW